MASAWPLFGLYLNAWIDKPGPTREEHPMLYAMLVASVTLNFVLLLAPFQGRSNRLARLFQAQEVWAELMDRESRNRVRNAPGGSGG